AAALCEMPRGRALIQFLIRPLPVAAAVLVLIFCFAWREPFFRETLRYSLLAAAIAVGMGAVVFSARYAPANWILNAAPVVWVGRLSYSLYVWHLAAAAAVGYALVGESRAVVALASFGACIVMAMLSYYALEQPLIGLRRRLGSRTAERAALSS
ncbi:MAG: acyltransferase family protein, partial [Stellaceae bacterium]